MLFKKEFMNAIRNAMAADGIDWLVILSDDAHLSEYTAACDRYREAVSGFTGSAGTIVISESEAFLWTDTRYHIQAASELASSDITLMKYGLDGVPSWEDFLCTRIWDGQTLGVDLMTISAVCFDRLRKRLPASVGITDAGDLLKRSVSMPKRSFGPIECVPFEAAGKTTADKLADIRKTIRKRYIPEGSYTYILSDLTSIMWLFNLRGADIEYVPVAFSYALITEYEAIIFTGSRDPGQDVRYELENNGVRIRKYAEFYDALKDTATDHILADKHYCNERIITDIDPAITLTECDDTVLIGKSVKNRAEIKGMENAHHKDAVTMIRFIKKIKEAAAKGSLSDEYTTGAMLDEMRIQGGSFAPSFKTICAYADNGAIVHYTAGEESSKKLLPEGFLLVDSGGQYKFEGTTDITRTISLGPLTKEEQKVYTTVLKGNLRLMDMIFPEGFPGTLLDAIAEQPLWEAGFFCGHGIGHGVGCNLSVHESEARISRRTQEREISFRPGVIISNEPGIYLEGRFGVRLENLLLVSDSDPIDGHGMCRFVPLSLVPFDTESIDHSLLSDKEETILSGYNRMIDQTIGPLLDEDERVWLRDYLSIDIN